MELVPEWAPNIHPMIVHFPIAFVFGAIGADLLALLVRRWDWLRPATVALYVVGGASAVFTYFTGTWAASAVSVPAEVQPVLTEHANLAWWTMWFFGVYALVRLGAHLWSRTRGQVAVQGLLFVFALGGSYLLYETGDHGAKMVYKYGVGAGHVDTTRAAAEPGLAVGTSGWQWRPQSARAWTNRMRWLEGSADTLRTRLDTLSDGSVALALTPEAPVTFVLPDTLGAVQVTAEVKLDQFEGVISLLHHVQGPQSYDYLAVEGSILRQGRVADGERSTFASGTAKTEGWRTIRVVGDGTHFRGYVDGSMVVHGHGDAAAPGTVGLRLDGTGRIVLRRLSATAL
ncbi:MAG: DUF2231 domain-containing protein [Salinibacter sp.]